MPVAHSPPAAATSPGSLSSSSGHGSGSYPPPPGPHPHMQHPLHPQRPSSGSASASGSPSDPGFMSLDEYGSSPGGLRAFCSLRSNTPESIAETPPARDGSGGDLYGYMTMDRPLSHCGRPYRRVSGDGAQDLDRGLRKRTYSLTTPARQRPVPQPSSASLDEYTLMRATFSGSSGRLCPSCPASSPKVAYHPYPEDYGDIEIGSHRSSSSNLGTDDGYMPMTPGVALAGGGGSCKSDDYMPMSPTSVSAPKQILQPRAAVAALPPTGAAGPTPASTASRAFPGSGGGYKTSSPAESSPEDSGYMRMWCGGSKLSVESAADGRLLPNGDYLNMSPGDAGASGTPPDFFSAALHAGGGGEMLRGVPGYCYSSLPRSYKTAYTCNGDNDQYVLMSSPVGRILEEERLESTAAPPGELYRLPPAPPCQGLGAASSPSSGAGDSGDYTEMAFGVAATPPQPIAAPPKPDGARVSSPMSGLKRLSLMDQVSGVEAFLQASQPPDPHRGAKVIRADPQGGRRRHSSETFSSTTTVTPVSPSFAHNPKRHNSASVENVSLRKSGEGGGGSVLGGGDEPPTSPRQLPPPLHPQARPWTPSQPGGLVGCPGGSGSPMRRETSVGFQNGLNYIAIDVRDEPGLSPSPQQHPQTGDKSAWGRTRSLGGLIGAVGAGSTGGVCVGPGPGALPSASTYASLDFLTHHLKEATVVKE
ncbi:insulin receptor substrate 2 [Neophocaena asiaeorientalis asiaeorientalis]|uniref:Insulin receptor substrate 2 n=1 Tax=Neophocaena asiaeorientalis asiaeorientalis TaxID=1706337 RepID=A0A341C791_NEOAA|nr:insulin receptor substrate 2 [Neophocaena asiaeorientalis asiaeorientalis]